MPLCNAVKTPTPPRVRPEGSGAASTMPEAQPSNASCADTCAARQAATEAAEAQTRATQQLNDQARNQKQQRKALQPALVQPQAPPEDVAGPDAPEPTLSKRAQRRRDKQAKQRQAALRLENKANEKEEEENRKVRKQVERLKLTEDTTVQQSPEALDSVKELVAAPFKEGAENTAPGLRSHP